MADNNKWIFFLIIVFLLTVHTWYDVNFITEKKKHMKLGASLNFKIPSHLDSGTKGTLKYTLSYRMGTDKQICFSHSYIKGNHSLPDVVMVSQVQRIA